VLIQDNLNININIKEDVQTIIPIFMADVMTTTW
jgi:hypothetical protein